MFTTARAPAEEIRRTLPKLQRLLIVFFAVSALSALAQLALLQVSDSSSTTQLAEHDPDSQDPLSADVLEDDGSSSGNLGDTDVNRTRVVAEGPDNAVIRKGSPVRGDLLIPGLVMALFGLSMSTRELHMRKRLLSFAVFTFLNFAASAVILLQNVEAPPGARHLLSIHCPVPTADIADFVRQQELRFRKRLAGGLPGRGDLLLALEEAWPVTLPQNSTIDLCSPSWALGNAYLIASGVLVLWMHAYAVRMLRSISSVPDDGAYPEGLLGSAGRVVLVHPSGVSPAFAGEQMHRTFVPFTGLPRKLDF